MKPTPVALDCDFLWRCKVGILQYVCIKPLSTFLAILLMWCGAYHEGQVDFADGYPYICFIRNLSVSISLYYLAMFYSATKKTLHPYGPVLKFISIKFVLFFTFWQSCVLALLCHLGYIEGYDSEITADHVSVAIQDALICVEMLTASVFHYVAFSAAPYRFMNSDAGQARLDRQMLRAARPSLRDVIEDFNEVSPVVLPAVGFRPHVVQTSYANRVVVPTDGLLIQPGGSTISGEVKSDRFPIPIEHCGPVFKGTELQSPPGVGPPPAKEGD